MTMPNLTMRLCNKTMQFKKLMNHLVIKSVVKTYKNTQIILFASSLTIGQITPKLKLTTQH